MRRWVTPLGVTALRAALGRTAVAVRLDDAPDSAGSANN